jgi:hypothetical protein
MKIENTEVFGLERSIQASGFPMQKKDYSEKRAVRLGSCNPGTGHDCFLKGIIVQADITAPQYWWLQWQRYHFYNGGERDPLTDIISSESKMHRILKMDIAEQCNEYVDKTIKDYLKELIAIYNDKYLSMSDVDKSVFYQRIIANCPMGLFLKVAIVTNYLQIKSMYLQRQGHKLVEWKYFRDWANELPMFNQLIGIRKKG